MDNTNRLTVKDWANEDRPREKMLLRGKKELSNAELIAILLRSGVPGQNVVDVAKEVLRMTDNSLTTLSRMDYKRLAEVRGLGPAKATTLLAALELGWRMQGEINNRKSVQINDSKELFCYMLPIMADLDHEEFWAIYLNIKREVVARQRIAMGGQTDTQVDMRVLFRGALDNKAVQLAVAHNHPSGTNSPSRHDRMLTNAIIEAGKVLQIRLIEHIIIVAPPHGAPDYYSFNDNGLI
ncbi:MAG: DNA repair protein RadC [Bacteroidales bacterium]|nr:DNA repair protein RadC [Bacteroidales bacterium]